MLPRGLPPHLQSVRWRAAPGIWHSLPAQHKCYSEAYTVTRCPAWPFTIDIPVSWVGRGLWAHNNCTLRGYGCVLGWCYDGCRQGHQWKWNSLDVSKLFRSHLPLSLHSLGYDGSWELARINQPIGDSNVQLGGCLLLSHIWDEIHSNTTLWSDWLFTVWPCSEPSQWQAGREW